MFCCEFSSFFFFKQKTAYEMRISDWSSDVCSSDLVAPRRLAVPRNELLTAREQEVVHLLGEGNPNKITAYRLGLSEATVRFHLRNIYRKLSVQNRTQALARYRALRGHDEGGGWTT